MAGQSPRRRRLDAGMQRVACEAIASALEEGFACVESFACPACGRLQVVAHRFRETLVCGECKCRFPSRSPRPMSRGELQAEHLLLAIQLVRGANAAARFGPDDLDISSLPPELQGPVMSKIAASIRSVLFDIVEAAEHIAGAGLILPEPDGLGEGALGQPDADEDQPQAGTGG